MNIHTNKTNNGSVEAVFHIPTPPGLNLAGVAWKDCVLHCGDYDCKSSKAYQKDDLPKIKTGEIVEYVETYTFSRPDMTDAEKALELEERYDIIKSKKQAEILTKLRYYGYEDDV